MGKRAPIKHRLFTILLLGAIVSALSVGALIRLLSVSTQHRVERASDSVTEEVAALRRGARTLADPAPGGVVGMRAGIARHTTPRGVPSEWFSGVSRAIAAQFGSSTTSVTHVEVGASTLVIATAPVEVDGAGVAWAAMEVRPLPQLEAWKYTIWLLALATTVLVATTVRAAVVMQRGAVALGSALDALSRDLAAPIPRPRVRELSDVAEGIARLVTSLARARREEERLARELSENERLTALGRVAAGVAHEVRNPLASIKLRLDLAASSAELPEPVERAISHASSEIMRLDRLVADLLVVAGRSTGPRQRLSLGELALARSEALAPWAAERGVQIDVIGDAGVEAHADSLGRALDNLLRNAVEASARGGRVTLRIEAEGTRTTLRVCDAGPGVDAARVSELFEPFFTTKPDGTGLGLPLARSIARAHGGDVRYARHGEQTAFELELPRDDREARPTRAAPDEARAIARSVAVAS